MTPLDLARADIGYTESPPNSNNCKYNTWYYGREVWDGLWGTTFPWCMTSDQYWYAKSGHALPYKTASCEALKNWYLKHDPKRVVKKPLPNDIVIYKFGHTGLVESVDGKNIVAIEGNTSPTDKGSQDNGGGVFRRVRPLKDVDVFIRPFDFESEEDMTGEEIYKRLTEYCNEQPVPNWAKKELQEAIDMGITDGSNPCGLIPRYQAAIMCKRAAQKSGK